MQPADTVPQARASAAVAVNPGGHALPLRFTGSGSEYFRIWIVNLLLTVVTLGLYYPWAKVRRLRYFYGNTLVDRHALDFHGEPKRMLRGYLLMAGLLALYSVAGKVSTAAGWVAFAVLVALAPALFRAAQQFRLANTSWRGLRFHFSGDLPSAYRATLPLFLPWLLVIAPAAIAQDPQLHYAAMALLPGTLLSAALFPWCWWLLKKYQHDHYGLGQVNTRLRTGAGSFYGVFLKTVGVCLVVGLGGGLIGALLAGGGMLLPFEGPRRQGLTVLILALVLLLTYAAIVLVIRPYATSRLQNLVWNRTKSADLRFVCSLRFRPLLWLTLKNWTLVLLTLGLYWPFAAIAMARMRLQAVTAYTRLAPDDLVSRERTRSPDAAGDAAGDLFGIDVGL